MIKAVINLAMKDASGCIKRSDIYRYGELRLIRHARSFLKGGWCRELCDMADIDYERIEQYTHNIRFPDENINCEGVTNETQNN
jgi:hypothetical protein